MADAPFQPEVGVNGENSSSDEECERCVVCLALAGPSRGGVSCDRCQDEFYCGVQHRDDHRRLHDTVCFPPRGLKVVAGKPVCTVCGAKALLCARCGLAAYCGREHQKEDWQLHKKVCKKSAGDTSKSNADEDNDQALGLATLPREVLLVVCALLGPYDLVRLGHVSRALRSIARDPAAWMHVTFPERKPGADNAVWRTGRCTAAMLDREWAVKRALGRDAGYGVLRVAPALGTLRIIHNWPPVNLLRYTRRVRRLELEWHEICGWHGYGADKLRRVLEHYRGYLQVLQLAQIDDVATLQFVDGLGLRELRLADAVTRTYGADGSVKGVAELFVGCNVPEDVLLELLRPCEPILTTFVVTPRLMDFCRWAHRQPDAGVLPALRRCAALTELEAPASWLVAGHLNHFPGLTTLHLTDLGTQNHAEVRRAMAAFPVARNIECLSVTLAFQGHRGLVEMVADSFPQLQRLLLAFDSESDFNIMDNFEARAPDAPRDLAAILHRRLSHLQALLLSEAHVPSTVLDGLASGLLPGLQKLLLRNVQLTRKGRAALAALRRARPALTVRKMGVQRAQRDVGWGACDTRIRCAARTRPASCPLTARRRTPSPARTRAATTAAAMTATTSGPRCDVIGLPYRCRRPRASFLAPCVCDRFGKFRRTLQSLFNPSVILC